MTTPPAQSRNELYPKMRDLPGVGVSIAEDYARIGITYPQQLHEADPEELFDRLELIDGPTDRCVLYVFRCARYAVITPEPEPRLLSWWAWKEVRTRQYGHPIP